MLITMHNFAKMAGVKVQTIRSNTERGYLIMDLKSGKLDSDNPTNKKYLETRIKTNETKQKKYPPKETDEQVKEFIDDYTNMASTEQHFKIQKIKMDIKVKEIMLREKRGDLVSKQKIADVCFSYLDNLNKNMLVVPQVFIDRVENFINNKDKDKSKSMSKKELLNEITMYITKAIKNAKQQVESRVESKYEVEDILDEE